MKVVIVDTGRSRTAAHVEGWRRDLGLVDGDEVALISWNHSRVALPLADHLVFGPTLDWTRREPKRAAVTGPRRELPAESSAARPSGSRLSQAAAWRWRRARRAAQQRVPALGRLDDLWTRNVAHLSNSSPRGQSVRSALGLKSDGVATDYAIAIARSADAAELAEWADVVVPYDVRSRKAAWMLTRNTTRPAIVLDMVSAKRVVAERRG